MRSARPKPLHEIAGRSMLAHTLAAVKAIGASEVAVVVGPDAPQVEAEARRALPDVSVFIQTERRGTAHAVLAAREAIARGYDDILVVYADTPLVRAETLAAMREGLAQGGALVALGFAAADPTGYGRLVERDGAPDRHSRTQGRQRRGTARPSLQRRASGILGSARRSLCLTRSGRTMRKKNTT